MGVVTELFLGCSYGFASGISPGPMLGLVVSQTMRRGWRAGNLAALTPLITDAPIILATFFVIRQLPHAALGWIGFAGGLFVIYLGAERERRPCRMLASRKAQSG